jgi:predicted DNA binding protein
LPLGGEDEPNHLVVCKTHFALPESSWHSIITKRHPETSVEVLGYSMIGDKILMDVRVRSRDIAPWVDELRSIKGIYEVRPFVTATDSTTIRVVYKEVGVIAAVQRLNLLLRTPFTIMDGVTVVTTAGPEENIQRFMKMFPLLVQVDAVYNTERNDDSSLTRRQLEIFHRAMAEGYFDVPRRVTLTELAARIGVAVSSLSEMLAVIEKKLLQDSKVAKTWE